MADADKVVVEVLANIDDYQANMGKAATSGAQALSSIERSASGAEASVRGSLTKIGETSKSAGASQLILQSIIRRTTDQFAAGAPIATIFAEHISGLAEAGEMAGGKLGAMGEILSGPWGIAISAAVSIASIFAQKLFEGGEAAKHQKDALELLSDALEKYKRLQGDAVDNEYVGLRLAEEQTNRLVKAQEARIAVTQKQLDLAKRQAAFDAQGGGDDPQKGRVSASGRDSSQIAALQAQLARQQNALTGYQRLSRVATGNRITADDAADPTGRDKFGTSAANVKAAEDKYALTLNNLQVGLAKGNLTQTQYDAALHKASVALEKVKNSDKNEKADNAAERRAEAEARKAEEARKKETDRERRVADEEAKLDDAYIDSKQKLTADTAESSKIARDKLKRDTRAKLADVDLKEGTGALTPAEAVTERSKINRNDAIAADLINQQENAKLGAEARALDEAQLVNLKDIAASQSTLALSNKERLGIALRVLAAEKEAERKRLQEIVDDEARPESDRHYSQGQIDIAKSGLSSLDARYQGKTEVASRQNESASSGYLRSLTPSTGQRADLIDSKAVGYLESFNGELDDSIAKSLHLHGIFGDILKDLLDMAIKQGLIKPLATGLFGGDSGSGGLLSTLFKAGTAAASGGATPGIVGPRASGGYVGAGQLYRVNEAASPGNVEGFRPQGSGTIIPLGQMRSAQARGTTIIQHISVDGRNSVTPADFANQIIRTANDHANRVASSAGQAAYNASPARVKKQQVLGS